MENRRLQTMEGIIYSKNDDERWRLKKQRKYNRQLLTRIVYNYIYIYIYIYNVNVANKRIERKREK